ncbi:MAG: hypothetical protein SNJ64_00355 [Endomicrobiia bacterium]
MKYSYNKKEYVPISYKILMLILGLLSLPFKILLKKIIKTIEKNKQNLTKK